MMKKYILCFCVILCTCAMFFSCGSEEEGNEQNQLQEKGNTATEEECRMIDLYLHGAIASGKMHWMRSWLGLRKDPETVF